MMIIAAGISFTHMILENFLFLSNLPKKPYTGQVQGENQKGR
jgi:hypothetical protein